MVDTGDLKSPGRKAVPVRVRPRACQTEEGLESPNKIQVKTFLLRGSGFNRLGASIFLKRARGHLT